MSIITPAPSTPSAPAKRSSPRWLWIALLGIVGLGAAGAWYYHARGDAAAQGAQATAQGQDEAESDQPPEVATVRLSPGGITRTCTQIGSVHPAEQADLYAKISGYLAQLHVNYGDRVKKGQILAVIDDPEVVADAQKAAADVRQSKAAVAQAEAFLEASKADRDATASAVEQALAEVDRYTSMKNYHAKKFARYRELVQSRAIPQQIADEEEEGYESAQSNEAASRKAVLKAKADLIAANARVKKAEADLEEAHANVAVAEAKRSRAEVLVGYTKILSPYDGVITKRNVFPGDFIRSAAEGGTVPLLTVARTDMVYVVTAVPDRDVPLADVGDRAEVRLDALGSKVFQGKVSRFAEAEDPTSRTMHTEIDLPNPKNELRAGMYGIATIFLANEAKSSTLPASCLDGESKGGKAHVYIIQDGKAKKTRVEVGMDDGLRVDILSGLTPRDQVIANPSAVSDGTAVRSAK